MHAACSLAQTYVNTRTKTTLCKRAEKSYTKNTACYTFLLLHPRTIPATTPPQPRNPASSLPPLPRLIDPKNQTRHRHQLEQIRQTQRLSLENPLQRREVNNQSLTQQTPKHGVIEHLIRALAPQGHFACEHRFGGRAARERVHHVEEHELCERQGRVAVGDGVFEQVFVGQIGDVGEERSEHDYYGGLQDAADQARLQHARVAWPGAFAEQGGVNGLDAEGLCGWAVHEDVC